MRASMWMFVGALLVFSPLSSAEASPSGSRVWRSSAALNAEAQAGEFRGNPEGEELPVLDTDGDGIRDEVEMMGGCSTASPGAALALLGLLFGMRTRAGRR